MARPSGSSSDPSDPHDDALPPIADPYAGLVTPPDAPAPGRFGTGARLALGSLVLAVVVSSAAAVFLLGVRVGAARGGPVAVEPTPSPLGSPPVGTGDAPPEPDPAPAAPASTAPRATTVRDEGAIRVVDVGLAVGSLAAELARLRAEASAAKRTLVVMTTAARCAPCRGVDTSLSDPRLQRALTGVTLARLDIPAFHDELEALRIPDDRAPGFFLLAPDLSPRDGIDGGEWDEDIPRNIAPVLGAFVRGAYPKRRTPWTPSPGGGLSL